MKAPCDAALARIYLANDFCGGEKSLADRLLQLAHDYGLSGATVLRGVHGFGPRIRDVKPLAVLADRPVVIELVDSEMTLRAFMRSIHDLIKGSLVTLQPLSIMQAGGP